MLLRALLVALSIVFTTSLAHAEKRVALVIGNSAYARVGLLPNPKADATAIAEVLRSAEFDVTLAVDLNRSGMKAALRSFASLAGEADVALIYYAGHGMEFGGINWLLPVDAVLASSDDVEDEAIKLDAVRAAAADAKRLKVIILDACRDNPFAATMKLSKRATAPDRGLKRVEADTAEVIAYAAAEGRTASDGSGLHSPYTTALLNRLTTPNLDVRRLFGHVYDDVKAATRTSKDGAQEPAVYFPKIGGADVMLVTRDDPSVPKPTVPPVAPDTGAEIRNAFLNARTIGTIAAWERFLARYPSGDLAEEAREEKRRLEAAAAKPNPPPAIEPPKPTPPLAVLPSPAQDLAAPRPSFCGSESEPTEVLICGDATISRLDAKMEGLYRDIRAKLADKTTIRNSQVRWIQQRQLKCGLPEKGVYTVQDLLYAKPCVIQMTQQRIADLQNGVIQ